MKSIACFDIGGTFIKYGILTDNGEIACKAKIDTPKANANIEIPQLISEIVQEYNATYDIDCIGISTAGQVDSKNGEIIFASENIPGYTGTKLSMEIQRLTGLTCHIENDVNSAALGELWKGDIGNSDTFVFLTLGTGIGGAIIIDGKLYTGVLGAAGEIGHVIINENGNTCTCGCIGCLESYASVSALIRDYCITTNTELNSVNGEKIINLVLTGDIPATTVYNRFVSHIVTGLINITHLLDPGLIIIGGGISEQSCLILDINREFKKRAMPSYSSHTKIISSSLKNDAGLIGACYVGLNYN